MDFKNFDQRNYRTVAPKEGYAAWAPSYEQTVPDKLDISVLESLHTVNWKAHKTCLDLACGTGRIAAWLASKGVSTIDGLDLTPEMLAQARAKTLYRNLHLGDVEATQLNANQYDLILMSLVDEHLADLAPVYREAHRLAKNEANFIVIGMHPYFFMTGMPTHFDTEEGESLAIKTHLHLSSHHIKAAFLAGWKLEEMYEGTIDDAWIALKPKWEKFRDRPVNYGFVWKR